MLPMPMPMPPPLPLPDLSSCDAEPIRVPGAIQPHGWMVVLDAGGALVGCSANWPSPVHARLVAAEVAPACTDLGDDGPVALARVRVDGLPPLDVLAHRSGHHLVLECEPAPPSGGLQRPIDGLVRRVLPALQRAASLQALADLAVAEARRLTGFGRALLYRFDAQGHGEVLAESAAPGYHSYLGHRFPASDVPAQARALYLASHVRLIADAHYVPVPLEAYAPGWDPAALDLGQAGLRSVSPVHLEYMRNMGTRASLSVSIVIEGRLWGMLSCHDHAARPLPHEVRAACEHLGRLLALKIAARQERDEVAARLEARQHVLELVAQLADSDATLQRLVGEPAMLRLGRASGVAVVLDDRCWSAGEVPALPVLQALGGWVAGRSEPVWATDRLAHDWPGAAGQGELPAGLLAVSISQVHRHVVLWFRPEVVRSVQWAGDPRKNAPAADGRIHPRHSFASWREELRGRSEPWADATLAAADELRHALIGVVLRRAEEMAEVAAELGRVNKELEAFSYTVSHDLRAPMRHIAGYIDLVQDTEGAQLSPRAGRYLAHVREAAAYAGRLVDALLDFSRMGRAALKPARVDTALLVQELAAEIDRQEQPRRISWRIAPGLPVLWADPLLVQAALRNLLGNAAKYTRSREAAVVHVRPVVRAGGLGLEIEDNGVGFQQKYAAKLFGVFQRLHAAEEFEGTGIGLATVRRIVERHGGEVWAHGEPQEGARFGFVLPAAPADEAGAP